MISCLLKSNPIFQNRMHIKGGCCKKMFVFKMVSYIWNDAFTLIKMSCSSLKIIFWKRNQIGSNFQNAPLIVLYPIKSATTSLWNASVLKSIVGYEIAMSPMIMTIDDDNKSLKKQQDSRQNVSCTIKTFELSLKTILLPFPTNRIHLTLWLWSGHFFLWWNMSKTQNRIFQTLWFCPGEQALLSRK